MAEKSDEGGARIPWMMVASMMIPAASPVEDLDVGDGYATEGNEGQAED